jgi:guanylate kinase
MEGKMIKTKKQGLFIVVSGPSGAGKGTICKELVKDNSNIWLSISATTRKIRSDDVDGKSYYFLTKEEFERKIKNHEFLEYAVVHSNEYYGTPKDSVMEHLNNGFDVLLEIDINGALQIKELFPYAIFIFILPPNMNELKKRLMARKTESNEKILERFKKAYIEINAMSKYNYVVVNDEIDAAVNKIDAIIMAEKCRVDRIEEVDLSTVEEVMHEDLADINK